MHARRQHSQQQRDPAMRPCGCQRAASPRDCARSASMLAHLCWTAAAPWSQQSKRGLEHWLQLRRQCNANVWARREHVLIQADFASATIRQETFSDTRSITLHDQGVQPNECGRTLSTFCHDTNTKPSRPSNMHSISRWQQHPTQKAAPMQADLAEPSAARLEATQAMKAMKM